MNILECSLEWCLDGTFKWYDQHGWPYNFENTENACVNVNQNHWVTLTNIDVQPIVISNNYK